MVEHYVGAETFKKGVNAYLQAHAYGNATAEDFSKAIAAASGKPVERILPTFVNQPGVPLLDVSLACVNGRNAVTLKQQRFFVDAANNETGRWQIPICVKAPGQTLPSCDLLTEESRTITVAGGCTPWVFANAGAHGYYRTAYPTDLLKAMAPRVETDLTAPERLSLLDDEWALVRAGRHGAGDYLTLVSGFGREQTSGVMATVSNRLAAIDDDLTTLETQPRFRAFVRSLLRPLLDDIAFTATAGRLRRAQVAARGPDWRARDRRRRRGCHHQGAGGARSRAGRRPGAGCRPSPARS